MLHTTRHRTVPVTPTGLHAPRRYGPQQSTRPSLPLPPPGDSNSPTSTHTIHTIPITRTGLRGLPYRYVGSQLTQPGVTSTTTGYTGKKWVHAHSYHTYRTCNACWVCYVRDHVVMERNSLLNQALQARPGMGRGGGTSPNEFIPVSYTHLTLPTKA